MSQNQTESKPQSVEEPRKEDLDGMLCLASWVPWNQGWGWSLTLQPGIIITVSKGSCRTDGFRWSALGLMGKKYYAEPDDAKNAAIDAVRRILTGCLNSLPNIKDQTQPDDHNKPSNT